jgi:hypothetical protein
MQWQPPLFCCTALVQIRCTALAHVINLVIHLALLPHCFAATPVFWLYRAVHN